LGGPKIGGVARGKAWNSSWPTRPRTGVGFLGSFSTSQKVWGSAVSSHSGLLERIQAAKRFLAFYRPQVAFPGISKASGHAPSAKSTVTK